MKHYKLLNNLLGWLTFVVAAITYILTLEPTASFWDCGEFISSAYKMEVGHPPGSPIFMLTGRFFANFASDPSQVAYMVNLMSGLLSAATILLLFWSVTHLAKRLLVQGDDSTMTLPQMISILGSGLVGALAYAFSDTFWYSAVEGEVYAYSSFCTALVFWLILKWESVADEPRSDRYLVLIAYIIGISIAVHLLNLLCIPAIVLVYYFRKFEKSNLKGSMVALALSVALIVVILYGMIPGYIQMVGFFELFFVNSLGFAFNTGTVFYFFATVAAIAWALVESFKGAKEFRIKLSFLVVVVMLGIPLFGGVWVGMLLTAVLAYFLFTKKAPMRLLNTTLLCLAVLFIGYSSYAVILIRSSAQPPMDENSPSDAFTLASYLNREQYGDRPLLYGETFVSEVVRDKQSGEAISEKGAPIWRKAVKQNPEEADKYIITGYKTKYQYNPELNMLFTRMYSKPHAAAYKEWSDYKGTPTHLTSGTATNAQGERTAMVMKPTFGENLRFFFRYQLNHMYWRYFMWNFAGRQNDIQGHGDIASGNWITGISFIDNHLVGDQTLLPTDLKENKGRNVYFMLPLLLGIVGLLFQAYSGKRGVEGFAITFMLFFMTGIAIVIYLNQTPFQPRERDYAYAGSFYAFAIWIGLGVAAIAKGLERFVPSQLASSAIATLLCLVVPFQMLSQNWDDHDRSGRTACRDFGMNYLSSVDENGIIFTNGDNDTFPLWYVQETEGFRTDVRVTNLAYLQTDWYINQMKRPAYDSPALPISMEKSEYSNDKLNVAYVIPRQTASMTIENALTYLRSTDKRTKEIPEYGGSFDHIPTTQLTLPIDSAAVVAAGIVSPERAHLIDPEIAISLAGKGSIVKNDIAVLDMLNTNSKNGWERPIYYATTVSRDLYMGLANNFSQVGLAQQVVPISQNGGTVDTEKMYDNVMNKFRWGGVDQPNVYLDETVRRMASTHRMVFNTLVTALIKEGKTEKAIKALDYCLEVLPAENIPHDYVSLSLAQNYLQLGEKEKGMKLLQEVGDNSMEYLTWYNSLTPEQMQSSLNEISMHSQIVEQIIQICVAFKEDAKAHDYFDQIHNLTTLFGSQKGDS